MKMYYLVFLCLSAVILTLRLNAQNLIWDEDFNGALNWDLTLEPGFNDPDDSNIWAINDDEGGVAPPGCGVANNGDNTLHVTCQGAICTTIGASGAAYNAGDGGAGLFNSTTDRRAAYDQAISTVGETDLEFRFDWIGVGEANVDFAELEYSIDGGATWVVIWTQSPGNTCPGGQGEWAEEVLPLPANAENQADLRFAFRWRNDNNGVGTDPSFAVNNLRLFADASSTTPADADFIASQTTICEGDCIDFTDNSTGTNISDWSWDFGGGATPNTSSDQNPNNVCFNNEGVYTIELTITDDNGTDTETLEITVNDCSQPNSDFNASETDICEGDCINFTDNSTGTNISSWDWNFDGGAVPNTSTDQNPSNICFNDEGTYEVSLTITDDNGTNTSTVTIEVDDCPTTGPNANFTISNNNPCAGDCIDFTDNSSGDIVDYGWDFGGGATPNNSTDQNPTDVCFDTPGTYEISLGVVGPDGTDTQTQTLTVNDCSGDIPNSNFDYEGLLCSGNCLDFEDLSTGQIDSWEWDFDGGSPATSTDQNPENICFDSAGVYNVSLTTSNANGTSTFTFSLNFNQSPNIEAFGDTLIDVGGTATLGAEVFTFGDVTWEPADDIFCIDDGECLEVEASPSFPTTYTASITDLNGCVGTDNVFVDLDVEDIIGVPSAFSPNNDGQNDVLRVLGEGIQSMEFRVFNRYGELVFQSNDQDEGWDGTFRQQRMNQGVYAYTLEYVLIDGTRGEKKGSVTLVK